MRERPILLSGPMVRAILDGRKSQTRRVVTLPHTNPLGQWEPTTVSGTDARGAEHPEQAALWHTRTGDCLACPHGQVGDRLWVRETWGWDKRTERPGLEPIVTYRADDYPAEVNRWRPSIHMPRHLCRLELVITEVRVERLQDISEEDAVAEGLIRLRGGDVIGDRIRTWTDRDMFGLPEWTSESFASTRMCASRWNHSARQAFRALWGEVSGRESWDANPWVWVVGFKWVME